MVKTGQKRSIRVDSYEMPNRNVTIIFVSINGNLWKLPFMKGKRYVSDLHQTISFESINGKFCNFQFMVTKPTVCIMTSVTW